MAPSTISLLLWSLGILAASCAPDSGNELGRVEEFQAELKHTAEVRQSEVGWTMRPVRPIPEQCMNAALRRSESVYRRNLQRRKRSFSDPDSPSVRNLEELHLKMLTPVYPCFLEQRVGMGGEGGKWICRGVPRLQNAAKLKLEGDPVSVVSIGSRGMTDFEEDMNTQFGAVPDTFDPFLPGPSLAVVRNLPFMRIHTTGLTGTAQLAEWKARPQGNEPRMVSFPELLEDVGRERVDVFKIDCESCEYGFSDDLAGIRSSSQRIGQMQMEVHYVNYTERAMRLFLGLEAAGYRLFHTEPNPYAYPFCYEVAYVHKSQVATTDGDPASDELTPQAEAECYESIAAQAEAVFQANWARKRKPYSDKGREIPRHMKWADVELMYLVADYPCQLQERFGVWGRGGAWVCLQHRTTCPGGRGGGARRKPKGTPEIVVVVGGPGSDAGSKELLFEGELAEALSAQVHVFNPSLGAAAMYAATADDSTFKYHQENVCGKLFAMKRHIECIGVAAMLESVNAEAVAVLRMDCEGCEFELVDEMKSLYDAKNVPFGQIVVRLQEHRLTQGLLLDLDSLGYRIFNAEEIYGRFELSFIHQSCL